MTMEQFRITGGPYGASIAIGSRAEREVALARNPVCPVKTPEALRELSERELSNLEIHVRNLEARGGDVYRNPPNGYRLALAALAAEKTPAPQMPTVVRAAHEDIYRNPPNGYAIALAARREGR